MREVLPPGDDGMVPDNTSGTVFIRVSVPELKVQKCLQFQLEETVWHAKQRVLTTFSKDLRDPINYGLYVPPSDGKAGKFMEEERRLNEYPLQGPIGFLEFKYKRRVFKLMNINERKLKQMHSKSKLKLFLEGVRAGNAEKISKMATKGLDPNFHDQDNGETPLTIAVTLGKSKCREVIMSLISGGAHLDFRNRQGMTALHRAAIVGNAEAIRSLLDLGSSPDAKDARDLTPLYYCVSNDDRFQECTHLLLHERARVGMCDEHGWYEIHQACKYGRVQHLEHLLFYGAEMDVRNSCGNTPLHVCALNNQEASARVLLFRGADPSLLNYNNQTAYQVALMAGNVALADTINAHNPDDVVPYREIPQYSNRRKMGSLTPSLRALIRCRSDPRLNLANLDSSWESSSPSPLHGTLVNRQRNGNGHLHQNYGDYNSDSACSISVSSYGSGPVTGVSDVGMYEGRKLGGQEGHFPSGHLAQMRMRRAGSLGDVNNVSRGSNQRNTLATLVHVDREQLPRVVLLHRSAEGYGFVLRGAKSKMPTGGGFNDFTPTAEYPALQYLDSVDPGSQADRAGLKGGDFILEINGENVVRASHERVVHLIRSSSDVLSLKVVTVCPIETSHWQSNAHMDSGAMTLPSRKKQAAPLPPQRDPRTSLSYSKASSYSMAEGLAEIEKLDATIAEFEGQELNRRHSMHSLNIQDDQKVASVRASHAAKRVSVVDYDGITTNPEKDNREHMGPAEARIKKYHKKSPPVMERSKSTPDISAASDQQNGIAVGMGRGGKFAGEWNRDQSAPPASQSSMFSGALQMSPSSDSSRMMAGVSGGTSRKNNSVHSTPELPNRVPIHQNTPPGAPPTPEVVRIQPRGKDAIYANVSADIRNRKKGTDSPYESSFRPGINAKLMDGSKAPPPAPDQTILKGKKTAITANINDRNNVSFADDRMLENAKNFIDRHPNATLLVTADIHQGDPEGKRGLGVKKMSNNIYEPEPDYDSSDDDTQPNNKQLTSQKRSVDVEITNNAINQDRSSQVTQNRGSVTVISISSDRQHKGDKEVQAYQGPQSSLQYSPPGKAGRLTSPQQSISSSRRSSGIVMGTPSQPSSAESSRRSSIQSNSSSESGKVMYGTSVITVNQGRKQENLVRHSPPPSSLNGPPPPPPPPPPPAPNFTPGTPVLKAKVGDDSTRRPSNNNVSTLPSRVSTNDIMAAVAKRQSRMEKDGPRLAEVKPATLIPQSKSSHELNQEALKEAVAKRMSRIQMSQDNSVVDEIEARINRNKKLQAAKYFGESVKKNKEETIKENDQTDHAAPGKTNASSASQSNAPTATTATTAAIVKQAESRPTQASNSRTQENAIEHKKGTTPVKLSPVVPPKASEAAKKSSGQTSFIDAKSRLKPVETKNATTSLTVDNKKPIATSPVLNVKTTHPTKGQAPQPPDSAKVEKKQEERPLSPQPVPQASDYITLAEKARQEYLSKKASGKLPPPNVEKKGPIEITPNRKSSPRPKSIGQSPEIKPKSPQTVKTVSSDERKAPVSIRDRIKSFEADKVIQNGNNNVPLAGVTEDHSHTEKSLSNGTIKKAKANGAVSPSSNQLPPPYETVVAPPPEFGDGGRGVVIDIVPPPSFFSSDSDLPEKRLDDAASFVSSVSSLSTLSSEHGEKSNLAIEDMIAPPPPPPPSDFNDTSLGDQEVFIPPPPEFLESEGRTPSSGNKLKPFIDKQIWSWSCQDVLDWLDSLALPQYRVSFAKACIDGAKLVDMGRNEFITLGVTQVGHRMNLERSVKKLTMAVSTNL